MFFFSSRRRHTRLQGDWSSDVCSSDLLVDEWKIDAIYSASQKCLSCTPGLSPVSFSERVVERVKARKDKIHSWFMDMNRSEERRVGKEGRAQGGAEGGREDCGTSQ